MKLIIAGGRSYRLSDVDRKVLHNLANNEIEVTEVVHGDCSGVDMDGEYWAESRGLPFKRFPANWQKHGKSAGPIRNREMAEYADAVALFPGGRGTNSMHKEAVKAGLRIFDFR